jgi:ComF family protein
VLSDWWAAFLDLIYPPRCPVCRAAVDRQGTFCRPCLAAVLAPREIAVAARRLKSLDSCRVLCEYTAGIKQLIRDLKFRKAGRRAVPLGRLLEQQLDSCGFAGIDVVVPVPLHAARLAERGYNQTELIFRRWSESRGWPWLDVLERVRPTVPQWELDLAARRQNIKGAFRVTRPEVLPGKNILLVDDILTTGLTLNECAKVLKKSGAAKVAALTLASGAGR